MRSVLLAALAVLAAVQAGPALAQADHAQRIATELVMRRAQLQAALCRQQLTGTPVRLPLYPPVGTGGAVPPPVCVRR
ncbi:hypothetical protein [Magnetospirillum sp. UT-4]|uniref:hypothetical protein n=1 Tax=Magnetospirillum sp. UT-4 TaxID=2681467 RepID=UPI00137CA305|nr:hypothetical protein [Magnetospirillum sp. UT-4]CAA7624281.1 exported hypothetical protein [Magnetospirillum sp. UT-4]